MEERSTRPCRFCGFAFEGRGIYADHALAGHNLKLHEDSCLGQQQERAAVAARKQARKARAYRRRMEKLASRNGGTPPTEGQLGFPFEGVPAIVS